MAEEKAGGPAAEGSWGLGLLCASQGAGESAIAVRAGSRRREELRHGGR